MNNDDTDKIYAMVESLEAENAHLKLQIRKLNDIISAKNRTINKLQHDAWDEVSFERDR